MAMVRELVVLHAGDVIVILPAFFFFLQYTAFVVLCLSLIWNQDFLAFPICDILTLLPCIGLRQYAHLILPSIFSVFLHAIT